MSHEMVNNSSSVFNTMPYYIILGLVTNWFPEAPFLEGCSVTMEAKLQEAT